MPDIDTITETEAAMLWLTSEQLDILLLCYGLGYSFKKPIAYLTSKILRKFTTKVLIIYTN